MRQRTLNPAVLGAVALGVVGNESVDVIVDVDAAAG
jgi:hypothetical protein